MSLPALTAWLTVTSSSLASSSVSPLTVTVCGASQVDGVNVNSSLSTVAPSAAVTVTTTFAVGSEFNTTV